MARGTLRIYMGAAPGVGKTYAMLDEGWRRAHRGTDVVVGWVETHGRANTAAQLRDLELVPRGVIPYRGQDLEEMDLDALLARRPAVALVDELAHTNVPGSRHEKRYQDVEDLLDAGIEVITTVNVQHLASLNDVVERITGVRQRETVPDAIVRSADQIELVDMHPEALRRRMAHGNIYPPAKVDAALAHYFQVGNLSALRELALLWITDRADKELADYRRRHGIVDPWETKERIVVALTGAPGGDNLIRRASRIAARVNGDLIGVHVRTSSGYATKGSDDLEEQRGVLDECSGRFAEITGVDVARSLVEFARTENATQLLLGASGQSRWSELVRGSVVNRVVRDAAPIDVHIIAPHDSTATGHAMPAPPRRFRPAAIPPSRVRAAWLLGTAGIVALGLSLSPLRTSLGLPGALLCLLLGVVGIALLGGAVPAAAAAITATLTADFFFTSPYHSFAIHRLADLVAVLIFFAVTAIVAALVDLLARRGVEATRSQAEIEALMRLAGEAVSSRAGALPSLVDELRRTFALDTVAVLAPVDSGWSAVASAGGPVPAAPDDAPLSVELAEGTVLVLCGEDPRRTDSRLLGAFVTQLHLAQERSALEAMAAAATELEEANSLRAALLSAVSHDLRTPLAAIKAAATSLLATDVSWDQAQALEFATTIDSQADRLTRLVSNLLGLGRLQSGMLQPELRHVDVADSLYHVVDGLGPDGSGIVVEIAEPLAQIAIDEGLFEHAVLNVIDNALAWSPPHTAIELEAEADDDCVVVKVVDHGPGVPETERERIFEAFQRLGDGPGSGRGGVGLGLAVARAFTGAMGGTLDVSDAPGGGAAFVFRFPAAGAITPAVSPQEAR